MYCESLGEAYLPANPHTVRALDVLAFDQLTLATDEALIAYQEQRLKLQATRKIRDNRRRADFTHTQTGADDEIAYDVA